jgi:hypothetical protein
LNGWFVTAPVVISVNGSDTGSGLASALLAVDGGGWQPNASLSDGVHTINFRSTDNAGNTTTVTKTVKVDTNLPAIVTSISGAVGSSGWYISQTTTTISATDLSGVDHIEYNQNASGWQNGSSVASDDGINAIEIRVYDIAGNMASGTLEVKVDTVAPSLSTSISGTAGNSGWYVSQTTASISANDPLAGLAVTTDGFRRIGAALARMGLPTVFVQEGGYLSDILGTNLTAALGGFEAAR